MAFPSEDIALKVIKDLEWFIDSGHHYCTKCVPVGQARKGEWAFILGRMLFPLCDNTMRGSMLLVVSILLMGICFSSVGTVIGGLFSYILLVSWHVTRHERDDLLSAIDQAIAQRGEETY